MVKSLAIIITVLALSMEGQAAPADPQEIGDVCVPSPDEWKCSLIGDGQNFCNYKRKICEKNYRGCNLSAHEIACSGVKTAEAIAVLVCAETCETEKCKDLCTKVSKLAVDESCEKPKIFMCDLDKCPQNWKDPRCEAFGDR